MQNVKSTTNNIKLNLSNIHSIFVRKNKEQQQNYANKKRLESREKNKRDIKKKTVKSPLNTTLNNIQKSVESDSGGSIFDKLFEFLGIMFIGILINSMGPILSAAKKCFDIIVDVFTPFKSGINLSWNFITGQDMNDPALDKDKKRVSEEMSMIQKKKDELLEKVKPLKPLVDQLQSMIMGKIDLINNASKNIVYARMGGQEGFYNKKTKRFSKASWTNREKSRVGEETERVQGAVMGKGERGPEIILYGTTSSDDSSEVLNPESSGLEPINKDDPTVMRDDHHPSSVRSSSGGTGVPFEAGTRYKNGKIFLHWTAGTYTNTDGTYHTIFTGDGKVHRKASYNTFRDGHTWSRNKQGVGLSIAALGGKTSKGRWPSENDHGRYPIKDVQLNAMAEEIARLALAWNWKKSDIKLGRVYTHAEIAREDGYGPGSGDRQTKWDLWNLKSGGPKWSGGNIIRNMAKQHYDRLKGDQGGFGNHNQFKSDFKNEKRMSAINQPMFEDLDDEEEMVNIYIQPVNTVMTKISYNPYLLKSSELTTSASIKQSQIWST